MPWTVLGYAVYYGDRPEIQRRLLISAAGGVGTLVVVGLIAFLPRPRSLHGDAKWASRSDIAGAGLLGPEGIILGSYRGRYLTLPGQQGVLLAAPPRSGKGVGVVIPNLLNWPGSVVCVDIKRENWTVTAGYRATHGQDVFLFDPFNEEGRTARWNPFFYVSKEPGKRINDLQKIGEMLYPDPPNVDPFWTASARSLFLGIALYLFETPSLPATLGEVLRQGKASDDEGFAKHWKRVVEGRNSGKKPLSPECVRALFDVIDLAPVTASSIRKTFTSRLDLWENPMLDLATAGSDFDLRDLRKRPMSIYVGVSPADLHRLRPVINLFFQQALGEQTRELPEHNPELRLQLLMCLDEFTSLGRIPILSEAIGYLPGFNVRVLLVIQSPSQLREVYGPHAAETLTKTLAARVVFAPKDVSDAREISDELGALTVKSKSTSRSVWGQSKRTVSVSEQRRPLLLPQEVKEIGKDRSILFFEGVRPILCRKIRYFEDGFLKRRVLLPPTVGRLVREPAAVVTPLPLPKVSPIPEVKATRPLQPTDLERLPAMTLDDFAVNLEGLAVPGDAVLSDVEIDRLTGEFLVRLAA
jgi:type IV secretion system protein VirD4